MSDEPKDDLSPEVLALLHAERSRPALPPEQVAQIRRGAEQSIALGPSVQSATWSRRWIGRGLWLFIGITLGAAGFSWLRPNGPVRTQVLVRLVYIDATVPSDITTHIDAAIPIDPPEARAAETYSAHAPAPRLSDDRSERALVERGRSALLRQDPTAVIEAAQEHARRFSNGALCEEREALWIRALVDVGRNSDARVRADAFVHRWPRSLLRPSIEAALRRER